MPTHSFITTSHCLLRLPRKDIYKLTVLGLRGIFIPDMFKSTWCPYFWPMEQCEGNKKNKRNRKSYLSISSPNASPNATSKSCQWQSRIRRKDADSVRKRKWGIRSLSRCTKARSPGCAHALKTIMSRPSKVEKEEKFKTRVLHPSFRRLSLFLCFQNQRWRLDASASNEKPAILLENCCLYEGVNHEWF